MIPNDPRKPQDERKARSPRNTPAGIGLVIGILLFACIYGPIYFFTFRELGAVSSFAGINAIVFGIAFAFIGGAIEYHIRGRK